MALEFSGSYVAIPDSMTLVHWLLMGGLLHLVQQGVPSSLYQMIILFHNGPLLQVLKCPLKG